MGKGTSTSVLEILDLYNSLVAGTTEAGTMARTTVPRQPRNDSLIATEVRSVLTQSEQQVIVGLFLGLSAKEIANGRKSSNRTVEGHVASIKLKIGKKRLSGIVLSALFEECLAGGFD